MTWNSSTLLNSSESTTWFGEGYSSCLHEFAREITAGRGGLTRAVLVSGPGFGRRAWSRDVLQGLAGLQLDFEVHPGMPTPRAIARLAARLKDKRPDVVIAVGGGSVMDAAKCAAALAGRGRADEDAVRALCGGAACPPGIPVLAVPSTPGTGAEATPFATVWDRRAGRKLSLRGPGVRPRGAVLDPGLLDGLPRPQVESCLLDALAQAMEAGWSTQGNEESGAFALQSLGCLRDLLGQEAGHRPAAAERAALMLAGHYSGCAIAVAGTTLCHALSYPMTLQLGLPHGYACGLTLAGVLLYNAGTGTGDCRDPRGPQRVRRVIQDAAAVMGCRQPADLACRITAFIRSSVVPYPAGTEEDPDRIAAEALSYDRAGNNPRRISTRQAAALVSAALATRGRSS